MARGWESKSVEAQQEQASAARPKQKALSADERDITQRRRTLELARARTLADLGRCTAAPHRQMLEQALKAIDDQIGKL